MLPLTSPSEARLHQTDGIHGGRPALDLKPSLCALLAVLLLADAETSQVRRDTLLLEHYRFL